MGISQRPQEILASPHYSAPRYMRISNRINRRFSGCSIYLHVILGPDGGLTAGKCAQWFLVNDTSDVKTNGERLGVGSSLLLVLSLKYLLHHMVECV